MGELSSAEGTEGSAELEEVRQSNFRFHIEAIILFALNMYVQDLGLERRKMASFEKYIRIFTADLNIKSAAIGGMSANADYTDTNITNFIAPPSAAGTFNPLPLSQNGVRVKSTDTSVYLNVTKSTYNVSVQTWGLTDTRWSASGKNRTCNAYGSLTTSVTVSVGHRYQIKNTINESGYSCAGLKFCSTNQYNSSTITGKWSPDYSYESGVIVAG